MTDTFVISGLAKRRATLSGEIIQIEKHLKQKVLDLKTLDAAIRLFDADYPIETIKPRALHATEWDNRGELIRLVFNILRESPKALSARDITLQVMAQKQMDASRRSAVIRVRRRVGEALRRKRIDGLVRSRRDPDQPLLWELITLPPAANSLSTAC